jgi:hypothetical protein
VTKLQEVSAMPNAANHGNPDTEKNKGGRPLKYTPEDVIPKVEKYLESTPDEELTITGLALACGFCTRQMLDEYVKHDGFGDVLKRARLRVEQSYERTCRTGRNPAGSIFPLKQMGWKDKQEIEHSGGVSINMVERLTPDTDD